MSRYLRTLSTISVAALICSLVLVAAPAPAVEAQTYDPCDGLSQERCIIVDYIPDQNPPPVERRECSFSTDNDCSLRAAINKANAIAGTDRVRIIFAVEQGEPGYEPSTYQSQLVETWVVRVVAPLPALTRNNIEIDGFTQEAFLPGSQNQFGPTIIIDGVNLTQGSRGLTILSSNNIISNLGIINFNKTTGVAGVGIEIAPNTSPANPATGNQIFGCYLGIDKVGAAPAANVYGMWIKSNDNIVGGNINTNGQRNLISGNLLDGVWITDAAGNRIRGNYIGLDRGGNLAVPNQQSGVALRSASNNVIGVEPNETLSSVFGNVIAGNQQNGIYLFNGSGNQFLGNLIGTNTTGQFVVGNRRDGVRIESDNTPTTGNRVGNAASFFTRNTISGNGEAGVRLGGDFTESNLVLNNHIGTAQNGVDFVTGVYTQTGVIIENGADNNQVGGSGVNERNIITANYGPGVEIIADTLSNDSTQGNSIIGNLIGPSRELGGATPQFAIGNGSHGIYVRGAVGPIEDTTIIGNTISASGTRVTPGHGIYVLTNGSEIRNTTIRQNVIGLLGTVAAPIEPTSSTGPSGNAGDGVRFERPAGNTVRFENVTIGSPDQAQRNIISRNAGNGINMLSVGATGILTTTIQRNTIQFNTLDGINVENAVNTLIDGQSADPPNLITNNGENGIQFTNSTTATVRLNTVNLNGQSGITIGDPGTTYRDVTIDANTVLTNTLTGIRGRGETTNVSITGNTVRGHNGSGIRWDGPAVNTTIRANTVYSNTLLTSGATPPAYGISLGSSSATGRIALISENRVRGNANGPGIVLFRVDDATISDNPEVDRNRQEGIRVVGPLQRPTISGNTVITNNLTLPQSLGSTADGGGGITLADTTGAQLLGNTVIGHVRVPGIGLTSANNTTMTGNAATRNQIGMLVTGGVSTTVTFGAFDRNTSHGIQLSATNTFTLTEQNQVQQNGGSGVLIGGATDTVNIIGTTIFSNTVNGIQVGVGGSAPHPQRVRILDNSITGNGIPTDAQGLPTIAYPVASGFLGRGIVFSPEGPPETATNPNHDINPPSSVTVSSNGQVRGQVDIAGGPQSCVPAANCRVQVFATNRFSQDGQGRTKVGEGLADVTGAFTVTVGTVPSQIALTATDAAGNTSRFGLFTPSLGIAIGPPRGTSAAPGEVITYTHRVTNTGNIDFANLRLTAVSSRQWNDIRILPAGEFRLAPGQSVPVTVTVRLPSGSDPRVAAGGAPDQLTVSVEGSIQFQGEAAPRVARASVVDTTAVLARVVLDLSPTTLNGRGAPGTTVPYAHVVRNNGNVAATFNLTATTNLGPSWATQLSPSGSVTLQPGEQRSISLQVTIPPRATGVQSGTVALTTLSLTTTSPVEPSQNRQAVDTTSVTLDAQATIVPDQEVDGAADQVTTFVHRVTNRSNGPATFRLRATSSLGSAITFDSQTTGVVLTGPNRDTFTLQSDSTRGPTEFFVVVNVRVNRLALPGQRDSIVISLEDSRGTAVGGAFVRNTINITRGIVAPRIYLPLTVR